MLSGSFLLANGVLIAGQAALVVLPRRGVPKALERLRAGGWAVLAPACVVAVVIAGSLGPGVATALSRLALVAVPLLAQRADLIVVPIHRESELAHLVHGHADRYVLHHSDVPVLVVPTGAHDTAHLNGAAG